jgi:6-methylsalicylate decarboxylase
VRIDLHAHVLTPRYESLLAPGNRPCQTPDALTAFMERHEIDAAVVSMGDALQARDAAMARIGNQELAELVRAAPGRFGAVAVIPDPAADPDGALAELGHALDTLGLDGVALFSNHRGAYLGDAVLDPLLAELDRRGAYVFVHPAVAPTGLVLERYPRWLFEYPFDTTRAIVNLIYTGALERFSRIRFQFAHLGGTAPFLAHRLDSLSQRNPDLAGPMTHSAIEQLGRLYYDTGLSNNLLALTATEQVAPADHIVYGSDWPHLAAPAGGDPAPALAELPSPKRAAIDADNSVALVPRLHAEVARGV